MPNEQYLEVTRFWTNEKVLIPLDGNYEIIERSSMPWKSPDHYRILMRAINGSPHPLLDYEGLFLIGDEDAEKLINILKAK